MKGLNASQLAGMVANGSRWLAERSRGDGRPPVRYCRESHCGEFTREGKPFGPAHVESNAYVKRLLATLDTKDKEVERVKKNPRRARTSHRVAKEILVQLQQIKAESEKSVGACNVAGLRRVVREEPAVLDAYLGALAREGTVVFGCSKRGDQTVRLAG